jgi:hydrogenase maturation protease
LPSTLICGLGNALKKDDGLGPCIISKLEKREMPEGVCLADFGISGFKCSLEIGDYDKVIFVDAIQMDKKPGQVYRICLSRQDLLKSPSLSDFSVSLHESNLERIMATAALLNRCPDEIVIVGCEPKDTAFGVGLTTEVKQVLGQIIELVLAELQ